MNGKKRKEMSEEIIEILKELQIFENVVIVFNGQKYNWVNEKEPKITKGKIKDFIGDMAENAELFISFETSPLYDAFNGTFGWIERNKIDKRLEEILKKYKVCYEQPYSWCICFYDDEM